VAAVVDELVVAALVVAPEPPAPPPPLLGTTGLVFSQAASSGTRTRAAKQRCGKREAGLNIVGNLARDARVEACDLGRPVAYARDHE
jgi:hypothetical protein